MAIRRRAGFAGASGLANAIEIGNPSEIEIQTLWFLLDKHRCARDSPKLELKIQD